MNLSKTVLCSVLLLGDAAEQFPELRGPYLGQELPGRQPELFAPDVYYPGRTINSVFSPDGTEFYFVTDYDGNDDGDVMWMRRVGDVWTPPEPAPFNSVHTDNDVCLSHDGQRLFWRSWRPLPEHEDPEERSYIWVVTRTKEGWNTPRPVESGGEFLPAGYPAVTTDGTLYFPYRSAVNVGESDIHRARWIDGAYGAPEHLGTEVNTPYIEGDMCVASDASFLVVAGWDRPDNVGGVSSDLYISFRRSDGTWSRQINLGPEINSEISENCPTLTPDGRQFMFQRYDGERSDIWWVDAAVLEELRPADLEIRLDSRLAAFASLVGTSWRGGYVGSDGPTIDHHWEAALDGHAVVRRIDVPEVGFSDETRFFWDWQQERIAFVGLNTRRIVTRGTVATSEGHLILQGTDHWPDHVTESRRTVELLPGGQMRDVYERREAGQWVPGHVQEFNPLGRPTD